jgi:hypothetical protein
MPSLMLQAAATVHLLRAAAPGCRVVACLHSPSSALWLDPTGWLLEWQPEEGTCQVLPTAMCGQVLLPQVLDCTLCQVRLPCCSSCHVATLACMGCLPAPSQEARDMPRHGQGMITCVPAAWHVHCC